MTDMIDMVNMIDNDLISRAAAIRALGECPYDYTVSPEETQELIDWENAVKAIRNVPAVELPRTGRWIKETDRTNHWHCSECGFVEGVHVLMNRYCPNCGAKCGAVKLEDIDK